jgi:hypothetical protein
MSENIVTAFQKKSAYPSRAQFLENLNSNFERKKMPQRVFFCGALCTVVKK